MKDRWPTEERDLLIARNIMQKFARTSEVDNLGMLELVVNQKQKRMNFRLCDWVVILAKHFNSLYGATQGDFVTRKILSRCMTQGKTLH